MAGQSGHRDAVNRTGKSLGERLLRKLQRKATSRVLERRDLLFAEGGTGSDRELAGGIRHAASALGAGLQATGAYGSLRAAICTLAR